MSNKNIIPSKRQQLQSQERKLVAELETEAIQVESNLQSTLKTIALVGAGILAATVIYKLATPEEPAAKKKKKGTNGKPSAVTASVISMALQKLIPLAIEKFATLNSKKTQDEKAAETTSR